MIFEIRAHKNYLKEEKNMICFCRRSHEPLEMQESCRLLPGNPPCCCDGALCCHAEKFVRRGGAKVFPFGYEFIKKDIDTGLLVA